MKRLLPAFFVLLATVLARGQTVSFPQAPSFSFTDNLVQQLVNSTVVQTGTMTITAKAATTGIDMSAAALTTDTPIEVTAGSFSYVGTLGDDPNYTPGVSTSMSVPLISLSAQTVGTLSISWTATTITFSVTANSPDDFYVISEDALGSLTIAPKTICALQFSDHRLSNRTAYVEGTGSQKQQLAGPQGHQIAYTLDTIKTTGLIDSVDPVCKITSLKAPGTVYYQVIDISGTASDNRSVADVQVQVNGGDYVSVGGSNSWTLSGVQVLVGTNTVNAISIDQDGNQSAVATAQFHYSATSPLKISIVGNGSVSGGLKGTTTQPTGRRIVVIASPAPGYIFDRWTGTFPSASARLEFRMTPLASLQAHFIPNPFAPVRGSYLGLLTTSDSNAYGPFRAMLAPSGVFSARFSYNGAPVRLHGRFSSGGVYSGTVTLPDQSTLTLQLELTTGGEIAGTLTDAASNVFTIVSDHAAYVPAFGGTDQAGSYTFLIMPSATVTTPRGIGYGNVTVSKTGAGRWAGVMGDGSPFTASANLSQSDLMQLLIPLYHGTGFAAGQVTFRNIDMVSDFDATLNWNKPDRPKDKLYPTKFSTTVALIGSHYDPATAVTSLQALDGSEMDLADGDVDSGEEDLTYKAPSQFTLLDGDVDSLSAGVNLANGRISGKFLVDGDTKNTPFAGVLFQKQDIIDGTFPGTEQTGSFQIYIPQ